MTATDVELAPEIAGRAAISGAGSGPWWQHPAALVVALVAVAGGIPLAMALGVLTQPRWYPVSDYAQLELRVRDITTSHPPLIGLQGRIFGYDQQGSHPGPIVFYALWPFYKLSGSQPWGLMAGAVILNLTAMGTAIAIAYRRSGRMAALGMAAALAVLIRAYDIDKLVEPWTPYVVLVWWVVFLLAVWSLLCEDWPLLPVAVFAGTFCVQATFSYMGVVFGVGAFATAVAIVWLVRRRTEIDWRRLARWVIPSAGLLVLLWLPPLIEQLRNDPGNLSIIRESFANPNPLEEPQGFGARTRDMWLAHLNIGVLATHTRRSISVPPTGPLWPGILLLVTWLGAAGAAVAARRREPALWRLHVVVGAALVFGYLSIARVIGFFYDYVVLWAWGTTMLLVVATVWTGAVLLRDRLPSRSLTTAGGVAMAGVLVVASGAFTYDAAFAEMPMAPAARFSQNVSPQLVEALEEEDPDQEGRYLFRWDADSYALDFSAWGLLVEMQRDGFDVGTEARVAVPGRPIRVRKPSEASAAITYVLGPEIELWRDDPDATELAYYDPRIEAEVAEYDRLVRDLKDGLREAGLDDLVPLVELHTLVVSLDERKPDHLNDLISRMYEIGQPVAVFLSPVAVRPQG